MRIDTESENARMVGGMLVSLVRSGRSKDGVGVGHAICVIGARTDGRTRGTDAKEFKAARSNMEETKLPREMTRAHEMTR
jgi:hypothetical protein